MVGRWQSGAPLALSPERDDPELGADRNRNNDFLYEEDLRGFKCPAGSHARRANPRDAGFVNGRNRHVVVTGPDPGAFWSVPTASRNAASCPGLTWKNRLNSLVG